MGGEAMTLGIVDAVEDYFKLSGSSLTPVERKVAQNAERGQSAILDDKERLRGDFIRVLLLNLYRDPQARTTGLILRWKTIDNPHIDQTYNHGISPQPVIVGKIDLSDGHCPDGHPLPQLNINDFRFEGALNLRGAAIANIDLSRCVNLALDAGHTNVTRDIWLEKANLILCADFSGTEIGGDLNACGAVFNHQNLSNPHN